MYVFLYVYNLLNLRMILDNVSVYVAPFAIFLILSFFLRFEFPLFRTRCANA